MNVVFLEIHKFQVWICHEVICRETCFFMGFVDVCWFTDLELATPDRGTQHSRFWARRASVDPTSPEHRHQQLLYFLGSGRVIFFFSEKSSTSGTNWRYSTPSSLAVWIKIPGGVTHPKNLPSCTKESTTSCVKCQVIKNDKCGFYPPGK